MAERVDNLEITDFLSILKVFGIQNLCPGT